MKFGPVPLDAALGAILAHSHPGAEGRLRKGRCVCFLPPFLLL